MVVPPACGPPPCGGAVGGAGRLTATRLTADGHRLCLQVDHPEVLTGSPHVRIGRSAWALAARPAPLRIQPVRC